MLKKIDFQTLFNVPSHSEEISIISKKNFPWFQLGVKAQLELSRLHTGLCQVGAAKLERTVFAFNKNVFSYRVLANRQ